MASMRHSTGIPALDEVLGGGLVPGTMTVILGATGIGKTQLGLQYAAAGQTQEKRRGIVFDMSSRGDSQNHSAYAERMSAWQLTPASTSETFDADAFLKHADQLGDYLHVFDYSGSRVTRDDMEFEQWDDWQRQINLKLRSSIAFMFGNFISGCRRVVIDGLEPTDRPSNSIQFHLLEYLYHQVLRKEPEWVARDLFREKYRQFADVISKIAYPHQETSCVVLATSKEVMLDELISRPIEQGDLLSNANTIVLMGKYRDGIKIGRALHVSKHRGSAVREDIVPYEITSSGIRLLG